MSLTERHAQECVPYKIPNPVKLPVAIHHPACDSVVSNMCKQTNNKPNNANASNCWIKMMSLTKGLVSGYWHNIDTEFFFRWLTNTYPAISARQSPSKETGVFCLVIIELNKWIYRENLTWGGPSGNAVICWRGTLLLCFTNVWISWQFLGFRSSLKKQTYAKKRRRMLLLSCLGISLSSSEVHTSRGGVAQQQNTLLARMKVVVLVSSTHAKTNKQNPNKTASGWSALTRSRGLIITAITENRGSHWEEDVLMHLKWELDGDGSLSVG